MTANYADLRILICEDEYLVAMDMAEQMTSLGVEVVGIVGSVAEIRRALAATPFKANAAVMDVRFADGTTFDLVPMLEAAGVAVAFCSGYNQDDRPDHLRHVPWLNKPCDARDVLDALHASLQARSGVKSV